MSVPDVERIEAHERAVLEALPGVDAEHVPRTENERYDAVLASPFRSTPPIVLTDRLELDEGTPLELKTCRRWITDNHSRGGRRRGQFKVNESTHGYLAELEGAYLFVVLDDVGDVLAGRAVPASILNGGGISWHESGSRYESRRATVPWFRVVPKRWLQ